MRNIITELSQLAPLGRGEEAFNIYATHQVGEERVDTGPHLVIMSATDDQTAHERTREWLLQDPAIVDHNIKPLSPEEFATTRRERAVDHLAKMATNIALLHSSSRYK